MGLWNGAGTLKQCFILPKNGSKHYLKYTFLAFPVLGILGLRTPLVCCLFACNDFGQHNPSLPTHATKATTHVAYNRHVPRRVPRPCPCTTD